jgi:hypothetical protein
MRWISKHANTLFVFFFTLLTRLLYLWVVPLAPLRHLPFETDSRAVKLLAGETIVYPDAWASFYVVLAGFYKAFDLVGLYENRVLWFALTQSVMAALAALLLYLISLKLFDSKRLAVGTGLAFALYYPFLYFNTLVLSETTFVLAVVAALYLLVVPERSPWTLAGSGLLLGIAMISRPILTPFIPLLVIWLVATSQKQARVRNSAVILSAFGMVLALASWVNSGIGKHHRFSYNGNTGVNFALAQCRIRRIEYELPDGEFFWFSPPIFWDTSLPDVKTSVPFYDNGYYMRMGLDCLLEEPLKLVTNFGHVANIYHSAFYPDFIEAAWHRLAIDVWKIPGVILTAAFFAYPLLHGRMRSESLSSTHPLRDYWLFAALMVSMYASVYLASPGEERYLVSYYFLLLLIGLPFVVHWAGRIRIERVEQEDGKSLTKEKTA